MARAGALLWGVGGLLALVAVLLPHSPRMNTLGIVITGYAACAVALVYALAGHRLPALAHRISPGIGTAAVTLLVWFGHGTSFSASISVLYVWVALYAAYFLRRSDLIVNAALVAIAHGAVVIVQQGALVTEWYLSTATMAVTGGLVHALVGRLRMLARTDGLTKLANRRGFEEALRLEMHRAERQDAPLSVAILDVDHFKELNDRFGHEVGDGVLRQLADAWSAQVRTTDVLCRYGGDEFVILLAGAAIEDAHRVVERLRETAPPGVSISAGVAAWDGEETAERLVRRADLALYEAKESGRDRSVRAIHPEAIGSSAA